MQIRWSNHAIKIDADAILSQEVVANPQSEEKSPPLPYATGTITTSDEELAAMKPSQRSAAAGGYYKKFTARIQVDTGEQELEFSVPVGKEWCRPLRTRTEKADKLFLERSCTYELKEVSVSPDLSRIAFVIEKSISNAFSQPYNLFKDKFFANVKRLTNEQLSEEAVLQEIINPILCRTSKSRTSSQLAILDRTTGKLEYFDLGGQSFVSYCLQNKPLWQHEIRTHTQGVNPFDEIYALHFDAQAPNHLYILGSTAMAFIHFTPQGSKLCLSNCPDLDLPRGQVKTRMVAHPSLPYLAVSHSSNPSSYLHLYKQSKNDYEIVFRATQEGPHTVPFAFVAGAFVFGENNFDIHRAIPPLSRIITYDLTRETASQTTLNGLIVHSYHSDETDQLYCVDADDGSTVLVKLKSIEKRRAQAEFCFAQHIGEALPFTLDTNQLIAAYSNPLPTLPFFTLERSLRSFHAFNGLASKQRTQLAWHYYRSTPFEKNTVLDILRHADKEQRRFEASTALFLHQSASGFPEKSELLKWLQETVKDHAPQMSNSL